MKTLKRLCLKCSYHLVLGTCWHLTSFETVRKLSLPGGKWSKSKCKAYRMPLGKVESITRTVINWPCGTEGWRIEGDPGCLRSNVFQEDYQVQNVHFAVIILQSCSTTWNLMKWLTIFLKASFKNASTPPTCQCSLNWFDFSGLQR